MKYKGFEKRQRVADVECGAIPTLITFQTINVLQITVVLTTFIESLLCTRFFAYILSTDMY